MSVELGSNPRLNTRLSNWQSTVTERRVLVEYCPYPVGPVEYCPYPVGPVEYCPYPVITSASSQAHSSSLTPAPSSAPEGHQRQLTEALMGHSDVHREAFLPPAVRSQQSRYLLY
ncbi:unnamed protein product [Arctogadus glacialis]